MSEPSRASLPDELIAVLTRVDSWVVWPFVHIANNVVQWALVFEHQSGDPSPQEIAPLRSPLEEGYVEQKPLGLEAPSSFWPKFEHRFRPAEALWVSEGLQTCLHAGAAGEEAETLFGAVLASRDRLSAALPTDGQTPRTRVEGLAILAPMRQLRDAMDAFIRYVEARAPEPQMWPDEDGLMFLGKKHREWWLAGPHEFLNY